MKWFSHRCPRQPEVSLLAAGILDNQADLEQHLVSCEPCRLYYAEIKGAAAPFADWEKSFSTIEASASARHRWRDAIMTAAAPGPGPLFLITAWNELFRPLRPLWITLACCWMAMLLIKARFSSHGTETLSASAPTPQQMADALQFERRALAELVQPAVSAPITTPPRRVPGPSSRRNDRSVSV